MAINEGKEKIFLPLGFIIILRLDNLGVHVMKSLVILSVEEMEMDAADAAVENMCFNIICSSWISFVVEKH